MEDGGELVTRPLTFAGNRLTLNFSTSAAGSIRVELQRPDGQPIPGFSLADCQEVFGDELQRTVSWSGGSEAASIVFSASRVALCEVKRTLAGDWLAARSHPQQSLFPICRT